MEQREFDRFRRKIGKSIAQKLTDYHSVLEQNKDKDNWGHSNWVSLTRETKESIATLDYSLQELSRMFRLSYTPIDMDTVDNIMSHPENYRNLVPV